MWLSVPYPFPHFLKIYFGIKNGGVGSHCVENLLIQNAFTGPCMWRNLLCENQLHVHCSFWGMVSLCIIHFPFYSKFSVWYQKVYKKWWLPALGIQSIYFLFKSYVAKILGPIISFKDQFFFSKKKKKEKKIWQCDGDKPTRDELFFEQ